MDIIDELWLSRHTYDIMFLSLIEGYEIKYLNESEIFYIKNDKILLCSNIANIWISEILIWDVFKDRFDIDDNQVYNLLESLLKTHLELKDLLLIRGESLFITPLERKIKYEGNSLTRYIYPFLLNIKKFPY